MRARLVICLLFPFIVAATIALRMAREIINACHLTWLDLCLEASVAAKAWRSKSLRSENWK